MKIPSFECQPGCHACCGIAPFTTEERDRAARHKPLEQWLPAEGAWVSATALLTMKCPFLGSGGCTIYDERPMVCRLFGAVDHPMMRCPKGCGPERLLSEKQSRRMLKQEPL